MFWMPLAQQNEDAEECTNMSPTHFLGYLSESTTLHAKWSNHWIYLQHIWNVSCIQNVTHWKLLDEYKQKWKKRFSLLCLVVAHGLVRVQRLSVSQENAKCECIHKSFIWFHPKLTLLPQLLPTYTRTMMLQGYRSMVTVASLLRKCIFCCINVICID